MSISTMIMDDPVPDHGPPEHRVHRLDARALEVADDRGLDAGGHGFVGHLDQSQLSVVTSNQSQPSIVTTDQSEGSIERRQLAKQASLPLPSSRRLLRRGHSLARRYTTVGGK